MPSTFVVRAQRGLQRRLAHARSNARTQRLGEQVARLAPSHPQGQPVIFFNASTRLLGLSLNAAFQLASAWAVRLAGAPVIHFVCQGGMSRCVLGTNPDDANALPPCAGCIAQSRPLYSSADVRWFIYRPDATLAAALDGLSVASLAEFSWQGAPLGTLCLPALRWALRRHHLTDDEPTRLLYRQYILSAGRVLAEFNQLLDESQPRAVVVFNGMFFPEATARWAAQQRGIRVISHEVGLRPMTAYFTTGQATAYPIDIPADFQLDPEQNAHLDAYLTQRMQGNFSMAGVRFWPTMRGLDEVLLAKLARFRQVVPVFTNVIFDTSQPHSNVIFPDMFAWLDLTLGVIRAHPETLFVIRAHPDETRPGKASRESVAQWAERNRLAELGNVVFVDANDPFSSYELIQRSKFVMVYNSTIGLEAALMGAAVLCGGKARFTQLPTVFFPSGPDDYRRQAEALLAAGEARAPEEFRRNARRFLYYQLYKTSLPFDPWIEEDGIWPGYVRFKDLPVSAFDPHGSKVLETIVEGILHEGPFLLEE
jgi:hypothetical protein